MFTHFCRQDLKYCASYFICNQICYLVFFPKVVFLIGLEGLHISTSQVMSMSMLSISGILKYMSMLSISGILTSKYKESSHLCLCYQFLED
jgi:hypothetical protein